MSRSRRDLATKRRRARRQGEWEARAASIAPYLRSYGQPGTGPRVPMALVSLDDGRGPMVLMQTEDPDTIAGLPTGPPDFSILLPPGWRATP